MFSADKTLGVNRWPVVRLGANARTEVVLLSSKFFALTTHWDKCTLPCPGDDCRLCETLPARGLFYVAVMCNSRISMLELGALSASHFEQNAKLLHGGMNPGLVVLLSRKGPKQPVKSEGLRVQENCSEVSTLDLCAHVMALYKFPCPNPNEGLLGYELRCRQLAKVRSDRHAERLSKAFRN